MTRPGEDDAIEAVKCEHGETAPHWMKRLPLATDPAWLVANGAVGCPGPPSPVSSASLPSGSGGLA